MRVVSTYSHGLIELLRVVGVQLQCQGVRILENFRMVGHLIGQLVLKNHCDFEVIIRIEGLRSYGLRVKLCLEVLSVEDRGSRRNVDGEA